MSQQCPPLNKVQVWTETGETWTTCVASGVTEREAVRYYMGQSFNIGTEEDRMVRVNAVRYWNRQTDTMANSAE